MGKVVYNACFGGFSLSDKAVRRYAEIKGMTLYPEKNGGLVVWWTAPKEARDHILSSDAWQKASEQERRASKEAYEALSLYDRDISRTDPVLVQVVEELGSAANGMCAQLEIAEVPSGTAYRIDEYDGSESVRTNETYDWTVMS